MKKTTKREVEQRYAKVLSVPINEVKTLLRCESPAAYTTKWFRKDCYIYEFGSVAICAGHHPFGNVDTRFSLRKFFEERAKAVERLDFTFEGYKALLHSFAQQFIRESVRGS